MQHPEDLSPITARIVTDSKEQSIDLDDPNHEYTVWADIGSRMQYCGSFLDTQAAILNAREHKRAGTMYVAHGPLLGFGILKA